MRGKSIFLVLAIVTAPVLVARSQAADAGAQAAGEMGYVKVEVKGMLKTGLAAPGGQTTGTIVETGTLTVELDLSKNEALRNSIKDFEGKTVVATGTLSTKQTINTKKTRLIVEVKTLKEAK